MKKPNRKPYWERVKDFWLVYAWSKDYHRYVCTNRFENQKDAELAVRSK